MLRIRLAGVALVALSVLPGCKCFGDRDTPTTQSRDAYPYGIPTSYPIASGNPNCGCQGGAPIPGGSGPIVIPPGATLPNPSAVPTIPPAGIKESPGTGKQFETNGNESSKGLPIGPILVGPVMSMPVAAPKKQ